MASERRSQEALDEAIRREERKARNELLRHIAARNERELERIFASMAKGIRKDLRAVGYTEAEVEGILRERFRESFDARMRQIEEAIGKGAQVGAAGDRRAYEKAFGGKGAADSAPFVLPLRKTRE